MFGRAIVMLLAMLWVLPMRAECREARPGTTRTDEGEARSPEEVFAEMGHSFRADRARGQHLRFQFDFSEPESGRWWIEVDNGAYTMGKGTVNRPDVTIWCTGADWVRLSNGTLGGVRAFLTGRLRVGGNEFQARKLEELFP